MILARTVATLRLLSGPHRHDVICEIFKNPSYIGKFVRPKSLARGEPNGQKPELRLPGLTSHMNVRRLIQISLVKADSIPATTQNIALAVPGGTAAYRWCAKQLGRWRFRRMFPDLASTTDAATVFDYREGWSFTPLDIRRAPCRRRLPVGPSLPRRDS